MASLIQFLLIFSYIRHEIVLHLVLFSQELSKILNCPKTSALNSSNCPGLPKTLQTALFSSPRGLLSTSLGVVFTEECGASLITLLFIVIYIFLTYLFFVGYQCTPKNCVRRSYAPCNSFLAFTPIQCKGDLSCQSFFPILILECVGVLLGSFGGSTCPSMSSLHIYVRLACIYFATIYACLVLSLPCDTYALPVVCLARWCNHCCLYCYSVCFLIC